MSTTTITFIQNKKTYELISDVYYAKLQNKKPSLLGTTKPHKIVIGKFKLLSAHEPDTHPIIMYTIISRSIF